MSSKEAKLKALQFTLDKMDKTYGKGAVMKMGDSVVADVQEVIPSGLIGIGYCLRGRGLSRERVVEIMQLELLGKTTLTLHAIAEAKNGTL